jgi:outer membrane protein TolC
MRAYKWLTAAWLLLSAAAIAGQNAASVGPRHITLQEAVQLALQHNHQVRIAGFQVEEKQHAKEVARSEYFPKLRNDSSFFRLTDTQLIEIPAGSLGTPAGFLVPPQALIINQGGRTLTTSGTQLTQPLTQLLKFKPENDAALADLEASRSKAREAENDIALKVHQIYYQLLVAQVHRSATHARIQAAEALQKERVEQVKYGSILEEQLIESRAQSLQAKQDSLATELQISDLTMQLNDAMGLPIKTELSLDPTPPEMKSAVCEREECIRLALEAHPQILEARREVEKASAGVRQAKAEYIPDLDVFARYSYQNNVPFLARNFGTFGFHFGYDLFEGGRRRALVNEREAQLKQAKENLARIAEEVELNVQTTYNKLERTEQMLQVSQELLALRTESKRVSNQELVRGAALQSQLDSAVALEFDARTTLLQSQLDYIQAYDEMIHAIGRTPE